MARGVWCSDNITETGHKKKKRERKNKPCSFESSDSCVCLARLWATPAAQCLYPHLPGIQLTLASKANNNNNIKWKSQIPPAMTAFLWPPQSSCREMSNFLKLQQPNEVRTGACWYWDVTLNRLVWKSFCFPCGLHMQTSYRRKHTGSNYQLNMSQHLDTWEVIGVNSGFL